MKITSLQNERIKYFNKLKENKIRQKEQLYLIEDVDLLYDALNQQCVTVILYDDESIIKGLKLDDVELDFFDENTLEYDIEVLYMNSLHIKKNYFHCQYK